MIRTYILPDGLDLNQELHINGCLKVISLKPNTPILFLFDEFHHLKDCISENVANAKELIAKANVQIVGVEGYEGGFEYDIDREVSTYHYVTGKITNEYCISAGTEFANQIKESNVNVVGIDSDGLCEKIEVDRYDFGLEYKDHPLQQERSMHFVKTLFVEKERLRLNGSAILNTGKAHIDHIVEIINKLEFCTIIKEEITCIRVRPSSHPDQLC